MGGGGLKSVVWTRAAESWEAAGRAGREARGGGQHVWGWDSRRVLQAAGISGGPVGSDRKISAAVVREVREVAEKSVEFEKRVEALQRGAGGWKDAGGLVPSRFSSSEVSSSAADWEAAGSCGGWQAWRMRARCWLRRR